MRFVTTMACVACLCVCGAWGAEGPRDAVVPGYVAATISAQLADPGGDCLSVPFDNFHVTLVRGGPSDFPLSDGEESWAIAVLQRERDGSFRELEGTLRYAPRSYDSAVAEVLALPAQGSFMEVDGGLAALLEVAPGVMQVWSPSGEVAMFAEPGIVTECGILGDWKICTTRIIRPDGTWKVCVYIYVMVDGQYVQIMAWESPWYEPPAPEIDVTHPEISPVGRVTQEQVDQLAAMLDRTGLPVQMRELLFSTIMAAAAEGEELSHLNMPVFADP